MIVKPSFLLYLQHCYLVIVGFFVVWIAASIKFIFVLIILLTEDKFATVMLLYLLFLDLYNRFHL